MVDLPPFSAIARTRVTIQQVTLTDDGFGGQTKSFSDIATVWASMKQVTRWSKLEVYQAQEVQAILQQQILIRYRDDISDTRIAAQLQVVVGTRTLNVVGIQNLHEDQKTEGKAFQALYCVEGDAA